MAKKDFQFTKAERELINNFCKDGERGKEFGNLRVRSYNGFNSALRGLNGTEKYIGTVQYIKAEGIWYFTTNAGAKYRIPEPAEGIDSVLDIEFKRVAIQEGK